MKNIRIRDKYNKKLEFSIERNINSMDSHENLYLKNDIGKMEDVFLNTKFLFDFKVEEDDFLKEIRTSIENLSFETILYLCDTYKFRFIRVYDYIREVISEDFKNYREIYSIFLELFKKGETINSLNLSIFVLYILNGNVKEFCKINLLNNIDHLEISSLILKEEEITNILSYEKLISFFYKDKDVFYVMKFINDLHKNSYRRIIFSFYIFNIKDIEIENLSYKETFILMEYSLNFKNAVNKLSNVLLVQENLHTIRELMKNFKEIVSKLHKNNYLNFEKEVDIKFLRMGLCLFENIKENITDEYFNSYIKERIIVLIKERNLKDGKEAINILNILDKDISKEIFLNFEEEYDSFEFGIFILRLFRNYRYYSNIVGECEKYFYITKVMESDDFKIVFLRSLSILYKKDYLSKSGYKFLKIIMDYREIYDVYNSYINFIVLKIIERCEN